MQDMMQNAKTRYKIQD